MSERSFTDLSWLEEETELRIELEDSSFAIRPIVPFANWLYDCQLGWVEEDGSVLFHDIGGQGKPGWDPEKGHGGTWYLHPDDHIETIVAPGSSGRAMLMSPMKSPPSFGEYASAVFELGQLRPGRNGAHNTHGVFWVPPGARHIEIFVVCPDSGSLNHGKSGALVSPGWGSAGTSEEGVLFVTSMLNCTMYRVTKHRDISPWIIGDGEHGTPQFMPREVFRAPDSWGRWADQLVVAGIADHHFLKPAPQPGERPLEERIVRFRIDDPTEQGLARLEMIDEDLPLPPNPRYRGAHVAPEGFGPFGGHAFTVAPGSVNLMQTTVMLEGALPYDAAIIRTDPQGGEHTFASNVQGGYPHIIFQGERMLLAHVGKSYSTGDFHYPDGALFEIKYVGA
jgi:hypothetical protein